jgi:shikimate kinase
VDCGSGDHVDETRTGSRCVPKAQPRPSSVFLVGFMGAGKTSVGQILSQRLNWPFEDLDDRIEAQEKRSIEEIFRDSGEAAFRRAESAALRALLGTLGSSSRIVALGGGAIVQPENARTLQEVGATVVFLDAPVQELFRRCQQPGRKRPLQRDLQQFRELYHQRRPFYMVASRCINTGGKDLGAVAAEVACSIGLG